MSATTNTYLGNLRQELEVALSQSSVVSDDVITNLFKMFCNIFCGCVNVESEHIETVGHCCLGYIDCIQKYIDKTPGLIPIDALKDYIGIVGDISKVESVKDAFLQYIAIPIFKKIVEPDTETWFAKELLRIIFFAVKGTPKDLRHSIVDSNSLHVFNLAKLIISTRGDYEHQEMLLDAIFHMCSELQINMYAHQLFPTSTAFRSAFCNISKDHSITDFSTFLTMVNAQVKKVLSLKCEAVQLGTIKYCSHEDELFIRADFNLATRKIVILCGKDSTLLDNNKSNNDIFDIVGIDVVNISDVMVSWFMEPDFADCRGVEILFNVTAPSSVLFASSEAANRASQVKLLIYGSSELTELITHILPIWFGVNLKFSSPMIPIRVSKMNQPNRMRMMVSKTN